MRKHTPTGRVRRWHCTTSTLQKAMRKAVNQLQLYKCVTRHTLQHSFATHLLESGTNIRTIQELMAHGSIKTTMKYTHIVNQHTRRTRSQFDML